MEIKAIITIGDEENRIKFQIENKTVPFEQLTREQQIEFCNSLLDFYPVFSQGISNSYENT